MLKICLLVVAFASGAFGAAKRKPAALKEWLQKAGDPETVAAAMATTASDNTGLCEYFDEYNSAQFKIFSVSGVTCEVCFLSCKEQVHPFTLDFLVNSYTCPTEWTAKLLKCNCNYRKFSGSDYFFWDEEQTCGPTVDGDPHFVGFDGTAFDFMGFSGGVFNVYSDNLHQVNALLDNFGISDSTFVKALGFKFGRAASVNVTSAVYTENGEQKADVIVELNGKRVEVDGTTVLQYGDLLLEVGKTANGSIVVGITTPVLKLKVTKRAGKTLHLNLNFNIVKQPAVLPDGVLGQTLQWVLNGKPDVQGDEGAFLVSNIFADDFAKNVFTGEEAGNNRKLLAGSWAMGHAASFGKGC